MKNKKIFFGTKNLENSRKYRKIEKKLKGSIIPWNIKKSVKNLRTRRSLREIPENAGKFELSEISSFTVESKFL